MSAENFDHTYDRPLGGGACPPVPHSVDQCLTEALPVGGCGADSPKAYDYVRARAAQAQKAAAYAENVELKEAAFRSIQEPATIQGPTFALIRHLERKVARLRDRRASLQNEINSLQPEIATLEEVIRLFS